MKLLNIVVATLLFFLLGATVPAVAWEQQEEAKPAPHQEEAKPAPHPEKAAPAPHPAAKPEAHPPAARPEGRKEEAKPAPQPAARPATHQPEAKPAPHQEPARPAPPEQAKPAPHPGEAKPTARQAEPAHQPQGGHPQPTPEQRQVHQTTWQSHRAQHWESEHRTWQQRGGYHGERIPQERYGQYFGPSHFFAVYTVPVVVYGGYPRFQYSGFWFSVVDPWPEYWAADWYDTDDVYIVYTDDGYYLVNRRYPGVMLAVDVTM
jgi:hypothetical protein